MKEFQDLTDPETLAFLKTCLRGTEKTAANRGLEEPRVLIALFVGQRQVIYITNIDMDDALDLMEGAIVTVRAGEAIDLG